MNSNVMTWKSAVEEGFEPRDYPYAADEVPMGTTEAKLEFKIWAKLANTISCFFTEVATGRKFQLSVYKRKEDDVYGLPEGDIDFKECSVAVNYKITIRKSDQGRAIFQRAEIAG